ncbi:amidase [Alteromonas sp. D210916BOD_24]|uniref:amidase n=1 Tax=Alteromonas sp. D210916BOD_24 TaxID=3157618 RepID=UPI00399D4708
MNSPFVLNAQRQHQTEDAVNAMPDGLLPLAGMGLAVKDLFHIKGLPTAAGNPDWLKTHDVPQTTNSTVKKLLNAGAVFKGKTVTDELAYSLHGQNKHYDPLVNPAAPAHIPGGSSSGSAVAVSAHLADIGLGTDTGGSIRVPASYQGLWGLRTTHGIVPCDNMVALAPSFDTVGWMTRDLETLTAVSQTVIDNQTISEPSTSCNSINGTTDAIRLNGREPIRYGIAKGLFEQVAHSALCLQWLHQLDNHHHCVWFNDQALDPEQLDVTTTFRVLQGAEIWQQHGAWIETVQPDISADIMQRLNWCKSISAVDIRNADRKRQEVIKHLNTLFNEVDVLIIPTTPGIAPRCDADETTLANDRNALLALTAFAGLAGLPQLHLPLFTLDNAPCGLSLMGKKGSDLALLSLAKELAL